MSDIEQVLERVECPRIERPGWDEATRPGATAEDAWNFAAQTMTDAEALAAAYRDLEAENWWTCSSCEAKFPRARFDEDVTRCTKCVEVEVLSARLEQAEARIRDLAPKSVFECGDLPGVRFADEESLQAWHRHRDEQEQAEARIKDLEAEKERLKGWREVYELHMRADHTLNVAAVCGKCGGEVHMLTCGQGCTWVVASECLSCGEMYPVPHSQPCERTTDA